jgi:outer membrane protein OmpA-like peptidoglycan-associated protein
MPVSPDIPAWINYIVVLTSGIVVATTTVNTLLSDVPDRWAFFRTWILTLGHVAIPPLLFWFLDYIDAIHDTSLFVALVVGFGYRHVFSGGVQGITLSGQTPSLWKAFEDWVQRGRSRILAVNRRYRERFDKRTKRRIATAPATVPAAGQTAVERLERLAVAHSNDPSLLGERLKETRHRLAGAAYLDTELTNVLWDDLRESKPQLYPYLAQQEGLVGRWQVWWWFEKGRSQAVVLGVLISLLLVALNFVYPFWRDFHAPLFLRYHHWRVLKLHATERDRHRETLQMDAELAEIADPEKKLDPPTELSNRLGPLLDELRYRELPEETAERILTIMLRSDAALIDKGTMRRLIAGLWSDNAAVRAHINRVLVEIQKKAYATRPLPDGIDKAPETGEPFEVIDNRVRTWLDWLDPKVQAPQQAPPTPDEPLTRCLENSAKCITEIPFASGSADLPTAFEDPLQELAIAMKQRPEWRLRVEAHTDNVGTDRSNLDLSRRRAATIVRFLTDRGVRADRVTARAAGEREPRASNETEEGKQANRRVEFLRTDGGV